LLDEIEIYFQLGYTIYFKADPEWRQRIDMTLTELPVGTLGRVVSVHGNSAITRRLMEMGVVPGVSVKVIKAAPFGDPLEIKVRRYSLALRKNEANAVEISI
jgi:ferrous iron transport protein A